MKKVFISSVIKGYEEYRKAAKEAVVLMDFIPVMSENFGSRPYSSEIACITEVEKSDIYLSILGPTYGFETSDGISVTHAEFRAAKNTNKTILVFIQNCEMEEKQDKFKTEVEDYSDGVFRSSFISNDHLKDQIIVALRQLETMEQAVSNDEFQEKIIYAIKKLTDEYDDHPEFVISFFPQPEKVVDIVTLENELDNIFHEAAKSGLALLKDGYKMIEESDFTGLESGGSKIGYFSDGMVMFITNPTLKDGSHWGANFIPPDKLRDLATGFFQMISGNSGYIYIGLRNMDSTYVAIPPEGSSMNFQLWGKNDTDFCRMFIPITDGTYNEWINMCVNRFSRTFKYK